MLKNTNRNINNGVGEPTPIKKEMCSERILLDNNSKWICRS